MKKILSVLLVLMLLATSFTGCGQAAESKPLVIGTMPLTVGVPVQYAFEKGYYKAEGLDVQILIFPTGAPINEAYAANQIDIAVSGLASVFSLALGETRWIGEINTTGGMGIYARNDSPLLSVKGKVEGFPNIYGSADLVKGIKILGPLGTVSQFNAMRYAQKLGLTSSDYEQVHMEYGAAYQAFVAGEGDAVALNPPFSFQAEAEGYKLIASFEDATGVSLVDGIFTSDKVAKERKKDVEKFIKATYKACADLQDEKTRFDFSLKWFNDNGKEYTEEALRSEMAVRDYIDVNYMKQPGYVYGKGMLEIANFFYH